MRESELWKITGAVLTFVLVAMFALVLFLIGGYFVKSEEINVKVLDKWTYTETNTTTTNGMVTTTSTHHYRIAGRSNDEERVYSVSTEDLYWRLDKGKTYTVKVTGWWLDNIAEVR